MKLFRGGLGSGKTLGGSREFLFRILSNHQYLVDRGIRPGALYLAGAPTYDLVEAGAWNHITSWLDEWAAVNGFALDAKRHITKPRRIQLITGDILKFVSLDRSQMFAGANAAGVWYDECELAPDPMAGWVALSNRLRDNRFPDDRLFGLATTTPRGHRGVSAYFADQVAKADPDFGMVTARSADNPGISASYIRQVSQTMGTREALQQLEGELVSEEGAVYGHEFSLSDSILHGHTWTGPRKNRVYRVAIDWGSHYHALIIEHSDYITGTDTRCPFGGTDLVVAEIVMDGCQDAEFLQAVCQRLDKMGINRDDDTFECYCDFNPVDAVRVAQQVRFFGARVFARRIPSTQAKEQGIRTVRWRLQGHDGVRRLRFSASLRATTSTRGIIRSMSNYSRKELKVDGMSVTLGVNQDSPYSHGPDALRAYMWPVYAHLRASELDADVPSRKAA
ncbi:MAG: hypothetical protein IV100_17785 [Myxococcales bacterium]|nr:hypothetical protein [Myxococcales bacterium]